MDDDQHDWLMVSVIQSLYTTVAGLFSSAIWLYLHPSNLTSIITSDKGLAVAPNPIKGHMELTVRPRPIGEYEFVMRPRLEPRTAPLLVHYEFSDKDVDHSMLLEDRWMLLVYSFLFALLLMLR